VVCLEPLAEVERALLVVEVLHAPHPEAGGLLLGLLGEHSAQDKTFRQHRLTHQCTSTPLLPHRGCWAHCNPRTAYSSLYTGNGSRNTPLRHPCPHHKPRRGAPTPAHPFSNYPRQGGRPPAPANKNCLSTPTHLQYNKKKLGQGGGGWRGRVRRSGGIAPVEMRNCEESRRFQSSFGWLIISSNGSN